MNGEKAQAEKRQDAGPRVHHRHDGPPELRIDAYETSAQPLGLEQRRLLHELTIGVLWPHRAQDLDVFLSLGKGYLTTDEIGKPIGSAMYFAMGDNFAMLGMM